MKKNIQSVFMHEKPIENELKSKNMTFGLRSVISIFVIAVFLLAGCNKEDVATRDVIKTDQIVQHLNNAETPEEIKDVIAQIMEKTGIGKDVEGSMYTGYTLSEEQADELSNAQVLYNSNDPEYNKTILDLYTSLKMYSDTIAQLTNNDWILAGNLDETLNELQSVSGTALNNPEDPNNALVMIINSKNGQLPVAINMDSATRLSPVQSYLFYLWTNENFGEYTKSSQSFRTCIDECVKEYQSCVAPFYWWWWRPKCIAQLHICYHDCVRLHFGGAGS